MSTTTFDYILYHIKDSITLQNTNYRTCIPPTEMLAVTLRYVVKYYSITATRRRMKCWEDTSQVEIPSPICHIPSNWYQNYKQNSDTSVSPNMDYFKW
ncbi:unnamed protein product [Acanthoscelides obtectus]|uniref:Uncharacterized protein n=1 Tax=Acanthoscelides obtectus TaxID=200917 RepID=A0A9P0L0R5_ACAOB|nr:unnamed protein product [Acanthoscelides obtectus]CAK1680819.1 hypothetical protein AOBTE_LOCUS32893 [Acanthoscelides obtectus]